MDAPPPAMGAYVGQVVDCLQDLRPVVIYFVHADVARGLRAVCDARGSAWEAYQVNWKVASPYAARRALRGFDGLVALYRDYRALCDDLFARLTVPKLALLNEGDWAAYRASILAFLGLPAAPAAVPVT
jgi:hypothetical protein